MKTRLRYKKGRPDAWSRRAGRSSDYVATSSPATKRRWTALSVTDETCGDNRVKTRSRRGGRKPAYFAATISVPPTGSQQARSWRRPNRFCDSPIGGLARSDHEPTGLRGARGRLGHPPVPRAVHRPVPETVVRDRPFFHGSDWESADVRPSYTRTMGYVSDVWVYVFVLTLSAVATAVVLWFQG